MVEPTTKSSLFEVPSSLLGVPARALAQLENQQSAAAAVEAKAWSRPEAAREPQRSQGDTRLGAFSYDIYISCAAVDNEPDPQGVSWVSRFARDLDVSLRQRLGRDIRRFFDRTSLRASAAFGDVLETALRSSAIFLPICSPSYFHGEWTLRELRTFLDAAKNRGEEIHVVPVEMLPLDVGALPPAIKSLKRHHLYVADTEGGVPIVLSPVLEPGLYYERLARLARDLALMLRELPSRRKRDDDFDYEELDLVAVVVACDEVASLDDAVSVGTMGGASAGSMKTVRVVVDVRPSWSVAT